MDLELISILTQTVADLELDWAAPEQPSKRWMDGSFFGASRQADAHCKLRTAADLALAASKIVAQGIGRNMGSLVVLQRHLWRMLTEMRDAEKRLVTLNQRV